MTSQPHISAKPPMQYDDELTWSKMDPESELSSYSYMQELLERNSEGINNDVGRVIENQPVVDPSVVIPPVDDLTVLNPAVDDLTVVNPAVDDLTVVIPAVVNPPVDDLTVVIQQSTNSQAKLLEQKKRRAILDEYECLVRFTCLVPPTRVA
jgi:hypothetical protein